MELSQQLQLWALRSYGETVESGDDQIKNGNVEHGSLEVPTTIMVSYVTTVTSGVLL